MDADRKDNVCPVELAGALDFNLRRLLQDPNKILKPFINHGMTVLDLGCGPGFFTIDIAKMVGSSGKVYAADLQDGMLEKVRKKIIHLKLDKIIKLHKCQENKIGLSEKVDLVFIFYMLHEVSDQSGFLKEIKTLLKPDGKVLIVEPKFHVSYNNFQKSINIIKQIGFDIVEKPKVFLSRSLLIGPADKK